MSVDLIRLVDGLRLFDLCATASEKQILLSFGLQWWCLLDARLSPIEVLRGNYDARLACERLRDSSHLGLSHLALRLDSLQSWFQGSFSADEQSDSAWLSSAVVLSLAVLSQVLLGPCTLAAQLMLSSVAIPQSFLLHLKVYWCLLLIELAEVLLLFDCLRKSFRDCRMQVTR